MQFKVRPNLGVWDLYPRNAMTGDVCTAGDRKCHLASELLLNPYISGESNVELHTKTHLSLLNILLSPQSLLYAYIPLPLTLPLQVTKAAILFSFIPSSSLQITLSTGDTCHVIM